MALIKVDKRRGPESFERLFIKQSDPIRVIVDNLKNGKELKALSSIRRTAIQARSVKKQIHILYYSDSNDPVMLWAMHFRWQKHLLMCSQRERMISYFVNSAAFEKWLSGDEGIQFPLYDVPGWLYTKDVSKKTMHTWKTLGVLVDSEYFLDDREHSFLKILFYKDAKWYYSLMIDSGVEWSKEQLRLHHLETGSKEVPVY